MYSDIVMEHFSNPRNVGAIPDADGVGLVGNPLCGDTIKIFIKVKDNRVDDIKFQTFGCGAALHRALYDYEVKVEREDRNPLVGMGEGLRGGRGEIPSEEMKHPPQH